MLNEMATKTASHISVILSNLVRRRSLSLSQKRYTIIIIYEIFYKQILIIFNTRLTIDL